MLQSAKAATPSGRTAPIVEGRDGVTSAGARAGYVDVEVGSGSYCFELTGSLPAA